MVGLSSAIHAYELFEQGHAAKGLASTFAAASTSSVAQTAFSTAKGLVGVIGTDRVVGALVKTAVKLAIKAHKVDSDAAEEMTELMQSRAPEDTGALVAGITFETDEDSMATVRASAQHAGARGGGSGDGADYARFVEFGTVNMAAQPYFLGSAEEVLAKRGQSLEEAIDAASAESDL